MAWLTAAFTSFSSLTETKKEKKRTDLKTFWSVFVSVSKYAWFDFSVFSQQIRPNWQQE